MSRVELWRSLTEAATAVQAAVDDYERIPTPQTRTCRDTAFQEYVRRLPLVVGNAEAGRYKARWVAYQEATQRVEQLTARLSLLPSMDAADRQLRQQFTDEQATAGKAFEVATGALDTALQRTLSLDNKPNEKSGK